MAASQTLPASIEPGLVSVVIPTRNRTRLLEQAIASCALQTWRAFEIIVVDDGSDEDVEGVVARARNQHALSGRLKHVRQERRGAGAARNLGLRYASGEFIQYLDSDDVLHPDKFATQAGRLTDRPELDMVFCLDELFKDVPGDLRLLWNVPGRADCPDDLDRFLLEDAVWQTGSPLWRRHTIDRVADASSGWDENLICWQDWQFHVAALCAGIRYECAGQVLIYIREHKGSRASQVRSVSSQRSCFRAGTLARDYLTAGGLWSGRRKDYLLRFFENHLSAVALLEEPGGRTLRAEMTTFMPALARSGKRRAALHALSAASRTPAFTVLWDAYRRNPWYGPPFQPLRNVIRADFLPDPPDTVRGLVDPSFGTIA